MKKTLSVLLAALMFLSLFAIGASASENPLDILQPTEAAEAAALDFIDLPPSVFAQIDADDFTSDYPGILAQVAQSSLKRFLSSPTIIAVLLLENNPKAYKSGKTAEGFGAALDALDFSATAEAKARDAFLKNDAALKAAYAAGTLKDDLIKLYNPVIDLQIAAYEKVAKDFFSVDALAYIDAFGNYANLGLALEKANLSAEKREEIKKKIADSLPKDFGQKLDKAIKDGNYKEAVKLLNDAKKIVEKILANHGVIKDDAPFFTKVWRFIVKWIFFGWLWQK